MDRDLALIKSYMEGNCDAFRHLVKRHQKRIYNLALNMLGNHHDAEDATQEIFIELSRSISSFKRRSSFATWLYRLSVNVIIGYLRREKNLSDRYTSLEELRGDYEEDGYYEIPDIRANPAEEAERKELSEHVRVALSQLPEHYRIAIILRDFNNLSYREIAEVLGCPIGTVKSRLHNATIMLGEKLSNYIWR